MYNVTGRSIVTTIHGEFGDSDWNDDYVIMVPVKDIPLFAAELNKVHWNYDEYNGTKISSICSADCSAEILRIELSRF